jgi:hypothetical protein
LNYQLLAPSLFNAGSQGASASFPAQPRFFLDSIGVVLRLNRGFPAAKAQDSRLGAPPTRGTAHTAWMRRSGLAGLFIVADL